MFPRIAFVAFASAMALCLGLGCLALAPAVAQGTPDYTALIAAPDRSANDRATDARRDPLKLLSLIGARPGMKVLDMGAGGGYSTELMARAVGPNGVVYGQNPPNFSERATAAFEARTKTPAGKPMVGMSRPFDDPLPADVHDLDLVTFLFFYHDTTYMSVDRAQMNAKLFAALKPGGYLVIADHSAAAGAGTTVGRSLHRIEESALRREAAHQAGRRVRAEIPETAVSKRLAALILIKAASAGLAELGVYEHDADPGRTRGAALHVLSDRPAFFRCGGAARLRGVACGAAGQGDPVALPARPLLQ
jgi:predicted methyltransferase